MVRLFMLQLGSHTDRRSTAASDSSLSLVDFLAFEGFRLKHQIETRSVSRWNQLGTSAGWRNQFV